MTAGSSFGPQSTGNVLNYKEFILFLKHLAEKHFQKDSNSSSRSSQKGGRIDNQYDRKRNTLTPTSDTVKDIDRDSRLLATGIQVSLTKSKSSFMTSCSPRSTTPNSQVRVRVRIRVDDRTMNKGDGLVS
jgi:hypothetical protein